MDETYQLHARSIAVSHSVESRGLLHRVPLGRKTFYKHHIRPYQWLKHESLLGKNGANCQQEFGIQLTGSQLAEQCTNCQYLRDAEYQSLCQVILLLGSYTIMVVLVSSAMPTMCSTTQRQRTHTHLPNPLAQPMGEVLEAVRGLA